VWGKRVESFRNGLQNGRAEDQGLGVVPTEILLFPDHKSQSANLFSVEEERRLGSVRERPVSLTQGRTAEPRDGPCPSIVRCTGGYALKGTVSGSRDGSRRRKTRNVSDYSFRTGKLREVYEVAEP